MKRILLPILLALTLSASAGQRKIFIVQTSDTHSCIEPISPNFSDTAQANKAGYMRRAALLERLRREYPTDLLLFDCGDFSQGSAYYNLFKGEVEVKLMNEMRYDACTIGNHEFDFGLENMARLFRMASFPIVCCNYDFRGTPVDGSWRVSWPSSPTATLATPRPSRRRSPSWTVSEARSTATSSSA